MNRAKGAEHGTATPLAQVPAEVYALPKESLIVGKSLAELLAMAPFNQPAERIRVRVIWARWRFLFAAELNQGWADELADPDDPRDSLLVVGYGPGFHDYKATPGSVAHPGFPNDHYRKLVDVGFTLKADALVVPDDQKGGVVSVVVRRPGGDGFPNNLAALLPWLLGAGLLALGFATGWFVHQQLAG